METNKLSVLRKNDFSVSQCLMVQTSIIAPVPFSVNGKQAVSKNGKDYRMVIRGHYKDVTPYTFVF